VQDIAFLKLMGGVEQQLLAGQFRVVIEQGGGILQLIAEAESPTRLVERRAAPQPTAQGLIGQPAVDHQIERRRWSLDLHGAQPVSPEVLHLDQGLRRRTVGTVAVDQAVGVIPVICFTEQEDQFQGGARL